MSEANDSSKAFNAAKLAKFLNLLLLHSFFNKIRLQNISPSIKKAIFVPGVSEAHVRQRTSTGFPKFGKPVNYNYSYYQPMK